MHPPRVGAWLLDPGPPRRRPAETARTPGAGRAARTEAPRSAAQLATPPRQQLPLDPPGGERTGAVEDYLLGAGRRQRREQSPASPATPWRPAGAASPPGSGGGATQQGQRRTLRSSPAASSRAASAGVADRTAAWAARRRQRLHDERAARQRSVLAGCTFVPFTNAPPEAAEAPGAAAGAAEFVARYRAARAVREREREYAEKEAFATGERWTGELTVPVGPRLGREARPDSEGPRCLEPPTGPPRAPRRRRPVTPRGCSQRAGGGPESDPAEQQQQGRYVVRCACGDEEEDEDADEDHYCAPATGGWGGPRPHGGGFGGAWPLGGWGPAAPLWGGCTACSAP
eukprot:TRINITY_DN5027_c1_g1_i1.p1 TRINITY_DN5027_c1_g1~~TRINITY_DN5027_c1_g1_i1.p1  ORF type:complete len:344 (+),score=89.32 TRINITY_DN5027_c1_g1_i1:72-1103(+)